MLTVASICLAIGSIALALHALGAWATSRQMAGRPQERHALPSLSLLKPIKGLEEELEQNLRSFFEQRYPAPLCLVFASTEPDDPGIALARRLAQQYPRARARFVLSDSSFGHNPKVSNLSGALAAAEHDLVLQTDANVRLRPHYLSAVVQEYLGRRADLLGALVAGTGERSLGAALENVQLTTFITPGICLAYRVFKIPCVIGKSIMFRKSELESLGGLACVKDVLAEDFVLGEIYRQAGKRVALSSVPVANVNVAGSVGRFAARHTRWLQMRVVVHVVGFAADLLSNAGLFVLLAAACSGRSSWWALWFGVVGYKATVDAWLLRRVRGHGLAPRYLPCLVLRDLLMPWLWLRALVSRTTEWRGQRFRLRRGSQLTPIPSPGPQPAADPAAWHHAAPAQAAVPFNALAPSSSPNPGPRRAERRG